MEPMVEQDSKEYPAVNLAYDIALNSYDWTAKRYDAIDARIQTILGVGVSITLAAPLAISALRLTPNRFLMISAGVLFLLGIGLGTFARLIGELILLSPGKLYDKWLNFNGAEFRRNFIFFAGQHMEKNRDLIARKHELLAWVTVIFFLEAALLAVGVALAPIPVRP